MLKLITTTNRIDVKTAMTLYSLTESCQLLTRGKVIAYPTEAVFGLGCDPDNELAVLTILSLKNRPITKGLILIADNFDRFIPYIDISQITSQQKQQMFNGWPGAITWLVPKHATTAYFLTGQFSSIAIRVTNHPVVRDLCLLFDKPIVSTSANLAGQQPCRTAAEVVKQFGNDLPILQGDVGKYNNPSEIRDLATGQIIRLG